MVYSRDTETISFHEIIPGSSVRVTGDNMMDAVDLMMVVTGKARPGAVSALHWLLQDVFLGSKCISRIGEQGYYETKLVSFQDALDLVMLIPGKKADKTRVKCAEIIKKYLIGDMSPVEEINANAAASCPIVQMVAGSLAVGNGMCSDDKVLESRKRKIEIDIMESQARFEDQRRKLQTQIKKLEFIKSLSPTGQLDDQVCVMFKNAVLISLQDDTL